MSVPFGKADAVNPAPWKASSVELATFIKDDKMMYGVDVSASLISKATGAMWEAAQNSHFDLNWG